MTPWVTIDVSDDGAVQVTDVIEGTSPAPFETIHSSDGEQLGRLILALGQIESVYTGSDPSKHVADAIAWLQAHD